MKLVALLATAVLLGCAGSGPGSSGSAPLLLPKDHRPLLEVVGVSNEVDWTEWKDARIGLGVQALVAERLFDTGKFNLLEIAPEVKEHRRMLAGGIWAGKDGPGGLAEALSTSAAEVQAYARVIYFGKPRTGMSVGVVHRNTESAVVRIEVTVRDKATGKETRALGEGVSSTTANSALFSYQEDRAAFDQTNVGNAVREAIASAVSQLRFE